MYRIFITAFIAFCFLLRTECFKLEITKDLSSTESLNETYWSNVYISENENDTVTVKIEIPINLNYSEIFVFFANDAKEILRVKLNDMVTGTFYDAPYHKVKEMINEDVSKFEKNLFVEVSANFSTQWLPKNFTRISATVVGLERYFNYYGIQNFQVSLPDLMVVEEFKNYTHN